MRTAKPMTAAQRLVRASVLIAAAAGACLGDGAAPRDGAELATVFDSTGDTVRATVTGAVPASRIRQLVAELRIASTHDDTIIFGNAGEMAVAPDGRVMLHDPPGPQMLLFAPDGRLAARIGRAGGGPGEYRDVNGLVALGDSLFAVYDASAARVSFLRPDGSFLTSWPLPATSMIGGSMLKTDRSGRLRLVQFIVPPDGDFMSARAAVVAIVTGGGRVEDTVVAPTLGIKQPEYRAESARDGQRSSTMVVSLLSPSEIAVWHPEGHFVLLEGGGYRLLYARRTGKPLVVRRDAPAIPVNADERAWHEERTYAVMRRVNPAWTWQGPPIPDSRAAATSMFVAHDGNVWVYVALPSEPIPEAERVQPRANVLPPARWRERGEYEVFASDGRFLGRVALPPQTTLRYVDGDVVWASQTDDDDVPSLVRFRVTPGW